MYPHLEALVQPRLLPRYLVTIPGEWMQLCSKQQQTPPITCIKSITSAKIDFRKRPGVYRVRVISHQNVTLRFSFAELCVFCRAPLRLSTEYA